MTPRFRAVAALVLLSAAAGPAPALAATDGPPVAPVENVVETHWGVAVDDPYRYMENLKDERVAKWIHAEADYTTAALDRLPRRDELLARIKEFDAGRAWRVSEITPTADGGLFYLKQKAEENVPKLFVRAGGPSGSEHLVCDPSARTPADGGHYSLSWFQPSRDGKRVLVGLAASGSEQDILYALDTANGAALPDTITRMEAGYTKPQWLPDGTGFFYSRLRDLPDDAPETEIYRESRSWFHRLGTPIAQDRAIIGFGLDPAVAMSREDFPSVLLADGSPYAIAKIKHGDSNEITLYAARLDDVLAAKASPWKLVCAVSDSVVDFAVHGSTIDLVTSRNAPRFKDVRVDLAAPDFASATVIVPAGDLVIDGVATARDAMYVQFQRGGISSIGRVPYAAGSKVEMLALPDGFPSGRIVATHPAVDGIFAATNAWTKAGRTYFYDSATRGFADTKLNPVGRYDAPAGYASAEVEVPARDGVKVPLSIIFKVGTKHDGSNPTLLTGYGSYGINQNVGFDARRLAWLEQGGVIAVAHVRGGGELGQEWHAAGRMATKPNTWRDFIDCGEYLVKEGWTSPKKLAGQGGSAGGITIGRAVTERPDLFAAALFDVGSLDAIRMETTTNGIPNIMEFGTVKKEDEFKALLEMSAYHHVVDGTKYPAVMVTHGINDPRVEPWESAKMTARMQAATASGKPVLFRVDYKAGHGIGSTRAQQQLTLADKWAFLLWQMDEAKPLP